MNNFITLAILIVVMEFAIEGLKNLVKDFSVWNKWKATLIPFMCILAMTSLVISTDVTILKTLEIPCVPLFVDYMFTILVCSQGSEVWHQFKKKLENKEEVEEDYSYTNAIGFNMDEEDYEEDEEIETNIKMGFR